MEPYRKTFPTIKLIGSRVTTFAQSAFAGQKELVPSFVLRFFQVQEDRRKSFLTQGKAEWNVFPENTAKLLNLWNRKSIQKFASLRHYLYHINLWFHLFSPPPYWIFFFVGSLDLFRWICSHELVSVFGCDSPANDPASFVLVSDAGLWIVYQSLLPWPIMNLNCLFSFHKVPAPHSLIPSLCLSEAFKSPTEPPC